MSHRLDDQEIILRKSIPVVINSFNQAGYLKNMIECFQRNRFGNIVIVDNASTDVTTRKLLLDLEHQGLVVIRYQANFGPKHFHQSGLYQFLGRGYHFFTDPDLDFDILSDNFVTRMIGVSEKYQSWKVGTALEIPGPEQVRQDLIFSPPGENRTYTIPEWEQQWWLRPVEEHIYIAPVDTTLHLFNPAWYPGNDHLKSVPMAYYSGFRIAEPGFVIRHLPWYRVNPLRDDSYENAKLSWNTWQKI